MPLPSLPRVLTIPVEGVGRVKLKLMQDLTVYISGPTVGELEAMIDLYESVCPPGRMPSYKIGEIEFWSKVANPDLTASGRAAAAAGRPRSHLEPVRQRIGDARGFEIQYWDGHDIDDAEGSWSFSCRRIHLRSSGLHAFVRVLAPLDTEPELLRMAAFGMLDVARPISGHGGFVFVYDPWQKGSAFESIYGLARRFWGVDVESLNDTLPLMRERIKGVNWLTVLGNEMANRPEVLTNLKALTRSHGATLDRGRYGFLITAGPVPVAGDQHRPDPALDAYVDVARALGPLFLEAHPDFPGTLFEKHANTVGWIRRLLEPAGWR